MSENSKLIASFCQGQENLNLDALREKVFQPTTSTYWSVLSFIWLRALNSTQGQADLIFLVKTYCQFILFIVWEVHVHCCTVNLTLSFSKACVLNPLPSPAQPLVGVLISARLCTQKMCGSKHMCKVFMRFCKFEIWIVFYVFKPWYCVIFCVLSFCLETVDFKQER